MRCFTIFDHPRDAPQHFVVRPFRIVPGQTWPEAEAIVGLYDSLAAARADVAQGRVCIPRAEDDDPVIVETWL